MAFAIAFLKKHKKNIIRICAVFALSALTAVLVYTFKENVLQNVEEDDAFGTVYALDS